jgi:hypothetical protein
MEAICSSENLVSSISSHVFTAQNTITVSFTAAKMSYPKTLTENVFRSETSKFHSVLRVSETLGT